MAKRDSSKADDNLSGFQLKLDAKESEKFLRLLADEGLMRAGMVAHQANNCNITVQLNRNTKK